MRPSKRAILASLTGIASFFFTFLFFLSKYYMRVMPSVPQPADGHVYPYDEHGWIVYLTWGEKLLIDVAIAVSFVSTAVLVLFGFFFVRDVRPMRVTRRREAEVRTGVVVETGTDFDGNNRRYLDSLPYLFHQRRGGPPRGTRACGWSSSGWRVPALARFQKRSSSAFSLMWCLTAARTASKLGCLAIRRGVLSHWGRASRQSSATELACGDPIHVSTNAYSGFGGAGRT